MTSDDQKIHAVDVATGQQPWAQPVRGVPSAPAIIDGRIIVGTGLGVVASITGTGAAGASPSR